MIVAGPETCSQLTCVGLLGSCMLLKKDRDAAINAVCATHLNRYPKSG